MCPMLLCIHNNSNRFLIVNIIYIHETILNIILHTIEGQTFIINCYISSIKYPALSIEPLNLHILF